MSGTAFVSFRASIESASRLKALAAKKGVSMQAMMREIADDYVSRQEVMGGLARVVSTLKAMRPALMARGVESIAVFGSTARGEDTPESDIDLVVDIYKDAGMSLTGFSSLRLDLEESLGRKVDLVRWVNLDPRIRASVEHDAIRVF